MAVLGATLPIGTRERTVSSVEAWSMGLAPTFILFGSVLIILAYAMYRGSGWVRWPITFWLPVFTCAFAAVAAASDLSITALDWLEALITMGVWIYLTWTLFRGKDMKAHLSRNDST